MIPNVPLSNKKTDPVILYNNNNNDNNQRRFKIILPKLYNNTRNKFKVFIVQYKFYIIFYKTKFENKKTKVI